MAFLHLAFECLSSSLVIFVKGDPWNVEQKESATGTEAGAQKERRIIYSNEEPQLTKCRSFLNVGYLFQNRSSRFHHFALKSQGENFNEQRALTSHASLSFKTSTLERGNLFIKLNVYNARGRSRRRRRKIKIVHRI